MTTLHDLIDQRFGVRTRVRENAADVTMTTTAAIIARADPGRVALVVINLGTNPVRIRPNAAPTDVIGIPLTAGGGQVIFLWEEDFNLVGVEFQGITTAGTSDIYVLEVLIEPEGGGE